jgi:hypothetical protein
MKTQLLTRFTAPKTFIIMSGFVMSFLAAGMVPATTNALSLEINVPAVSPLVQNLIFNPMTQPSPQPIIPVTPVVPVTPTPQPVTPTTPTAPTTPATPTTTTSPSNTVSQAAPAPIVQRSILGATDNGILKQSQIAAGAIRGESPPVSYTSKVLSPATANALFFLGVAGLCIGGWMIVVTRPKSLVGAS